MTEARALRDDRWLFAGLGLAVCIAILVVICRPWDLASGFMIGAPFGRDFANFWLAGHLATTGQLDVLTDLQGYNAVFQRTFQHNPAELFVFSYPPHLLLALAPFGALPFVPADTLWTAVNLVCLALTVRLLRAEWSLCGLALLSPAVLTMVAFGHFGGMLALLATLALRDAAVRPLVSGLCLAALSVKPQFALVLGLILLLAGYWRPVVWAVPATAALVAASIAAFGFKPWSDFVTWTMPFHARMLAEFDIQAMRTTISVYAGMRMAHVPGLVANVAQYAVSLAALARVVVLIRREGLVGARTAALALLAALVALPYVNGYDLAIAAPALTVALFGDRPEQPFLGFVPAMLLWLVPPFSLPFGLWELPAVPAAFALAVMLALFGSGAGRPRTVQTAPAGAVPAGRPSP